MTRFVVLASLVFVLAGCGWFGAKNPDLPLVSRESAALTPTAPPPVPAGQVVVDRVMAVINQEVITLSELEEAVAFYLRDTRQPRPEESGTEARALEQRVLQRLVNHRLQVQEAKREQLEVSEDELREAVDEAVRRSGLPRAEFEKELRGQGLSWEAFRRELRDQLLVQRVVRRRVGARVSVTDDEVEAYLKANRETFETVLTYRARHIAVLANPPDKEESWERAQAKIAEIRQHLQAGEAFAEVVRKFSEDPSAEHGGDLGTLRRGELAPLFERAILALSVGEMSEPIRSPQGIHLFLLEAKEELAGEALVQARAQARELLYRQKFQERLETWLGELRQRAIITLKPEQKS